MIGIVSEKTPIVILCMWHFSRTIFDQFKRFEVLHILILPTLYMIAEVSKLRIFTHPAGTVRENNHVVTSLL